MSSEEEREVGSAQGPTRPQLGSEEPAKDSAGADPRAASSTARGAEVDDWLANLVPLADRDDDLIRQVTEAWVLTIRSNRRLTRRRCWLSVSTAEPHAAHAREPGHRVEIYRAELRPMARLTGWESAS